MMMRRWHVGVLYITLSFYILSASRLVPAADAQGRPAAAAAAVAAAAYPQSSTIPVTTSRGGYVTLPLSTSSNTPAVPDQRAQSLPGPAVTGDTGSLAVPPPSGTITTRTTSVTHTTYTTTSTRTVSSSSAAGEAQHAGPMHAQQRQHHSALGQQQQSSALPPATGNQSDWYNSVWGRYDNETRTDKANGNDDNNNDIDEDVNDDKNNDNNSYDDGEEYDESVPPWASPKPSPAAAQGTMTQVAAKAAIGNQTNTNNQNPGKQSLAVQHSLSPKPSPVPSPAAAAATTITTVAKPSPATAPAVRSSTPAAIITAGKPSPAAAAAQAAKPSPSPAAPAAVKPSPAAATTTTKPPASPAAGANFWVPGVDEVQDEDTDDDTDDDTVNDTDYDTDNDADNDAADDTDDESGASSTTAVAKPSPSPAAAAAAAKPSPSPTAVAGGSAALNPSRPSAANTPASAAAAADDGDDEEDDDLEVDINVDDDSDDIDVSDDLDDDNDSSDDDVFDDDEDLDDQPTAAVIVDGKAEVTATTSNLLQPSRSPSPSPSPAAAAARSPSPSPAAAAAAARSPSPATAAAPSPSPAVAAPSPSRSPSPSPSPAAAAPTKAASSVLKPAFGSLAGVPKPVTNIYTLSSAASQTRRNNSNVVAGLLATLSGIQVPRSTPTVLAPKPFVLQQPGAKQNILIGCILPFQGDKAIDGYSIYDAFKMALVDKGKTILPGVNVNLTCVNTACNDIPAYNAALKFEAEGAVAVLGDVCSRASIGAAGVSRLQQLPMISPASTTPLLTQYNHYFRTIPSDRYQGMAVAELIEQRGGRNVGVVYEDTAYGFGLAFSFIATFTADGGNVPVIVNFGNGEGNATEAVAQMLAGKQNTTFPLDSVFIVNNITFAGEFLLAAKAANLGLKLFGSDFLASPTLFQQVKSMPSAVANLTMTTPNPGNPAFLTKFQKFSNLNDTNVSMYASRAYDAMTALLQAYKAAAAPKKDSNIRAALQKQKFTGVSGPIEFDSNGDLTPEGVSYVPATFNPATGGLVLGRPINIKRLMELRAPTGRKLLRFRWRRLFRF